MLARAHRKEKCAHFIALPFFVSTLFFFRYLPDDDQVFAKKSGIADQWITRGKKEEGNAPSSRQQRARKKKVYLSVLQKKEKSTHHRHRFPLFFSSHGPTVSQRKMRIWDKSLMHHGGPPTGRRKNADRPLPRGCAPRHPFSLFLFLLSLFFSFSAHPGFCQSLRSSVFFPGFAP